jgi:hypothetical protein
VVHKGAAISRKVDSCDVCLLLNLGLLTEERARIVDHPYLLYVPPADSVPPLAAREIPPALIHRELVRQPIFKALWRIGKFLSAKLIDGALVS